MTKLPVPNKYEKGTFKHDFIELWNENIVNKEFDLEAEFMAEIAEIIVRAGIYGN